MALLVVLAMEKSEGVRASGLCATAAIWLLDCSVEKKSERGKRGCCCLLCKDLERERGESREQVRMLLPTEREKGVRERGGVSFDHFGLFG